jgi:hypothetical protein
MNIDLRNRYRIAGNQPGEPPEPKEIGLETPADGLYLREDIEIRCNVTMVSFVKAQLKAASKEMVSRIIKKAELLDAGVLQAMMLDGKLKTINPNDRTQTGLQSPPLTSTSSSPRLSYQQQHASLTSYPPRPGTAGSQYSNAARSSYQSSVYQQQQQSLQHQQPQGSPMAELPFKEPSHQQSFATELPGDFHHPQLSPSFPQQQARYPGEQRWSHSQPSPKLHPDPYRTSISSTASSGGGYPSPGLSPQPYGQGYSAELPAHPETAEEYRRR